MWMLLTIIGLALLLDMLLARRRAERSAQMDPEVVITEAELGQIIEKEMKRAKPKLKLPALQRGELQEAGVYQTLKGTLRGRIKANLLLKYQHVEIKFLTQQRELVNLSTEVLDKAIERYLLRESIPYQINWQRKDEELQLLRKDIELAKARKELEELQRPPETLPEIVPDEMEELREAEQKKIRKKILKRKVKSEMIEELLKEKADRIRQISKLDLPEPEKERLKQQVEEDIEYTIREIQEGRGQG